MVKRNAVVMNTTTSTAIIELALAAHERTFHRNAFADPLSLLLLSPDIVFSWSPTSLSQTLFPPSPFPYFFTLQSHLLIKNTQFVFLAICVCVCFRIVASSEVAGFMGDVCVCYLPRILSLVHRQSFPSMLLRCFGSNPSTPFGAGPCHI